MTGPITASPAPALAVASRPDRPRGSAGRDAAVKAATAGVSREVAVTGLPGLPPRRFAAPLSAAVALVLAVTAALIFVAAVRGNTDPRAAPHARTVRKLTTRWPGPPRPAPPNPRPAGTAAASVAGLGPAA